MPLTVTHSIVFKEAVNGLLILFIAQGLQHLEQVRRFFKLPKSTADPRAYYMYTNAVILGSMLILVTVGENHVWNTWTPVFQNVSRILGSLLLLMAGLLCTYGAANVFAKRKTEDLVQAEEALQKAHDELEIRVEERTAELQAINRELEAFSYSVSHDLRTPFRGIDGFSQILLEDYADVLDEQAKYYLQRVRAATQNMGRLIDDMLNLSRIGRQPIEKKTINLEIIARDAYESLDDEWKDRKVNLTLHQCPPVFADPHLMPIVFVNLLSNALKFTRCHETAKIEVGSETKDEQTVFHVRDNGVGFDMKYAHKLFIAFQRLHRAEEYEGAGVGLAIVQRIIHGQGGRIWAESEVDVGTTFWFTMTA